jgi:undecaprenyl-diphosphatase
VPELLKAIILGVVEGATEFIPVSSTGHLIVAGEWIGLDDPGAATFQIVIQLGAILAVVWLYRHRVFGPITHWVSQPAGHRFIVNLAVAFFPAAFVGLLLHDWITDVLFTPVAVAAALVAGGIAILLIERWKPVPRIASVDEMRLRDAGGVGLAQVLSLLPGVSRSGATIMGGLAIGMSRAAATEFSFYVAIPTMLAATLFELISNRDTLTAEGAHLLAAGFVTAFLSALVVVKAFVHFISRHSFAPFAWYRIAFGIALLVYYL